MNNNNRNILELKCPFLGCKLTLAGFEPKTSRLSTQCTTEWVIVVTDKAPLCYNIISGVCSSR